MNLSTKDITDLPRRAFCVWEDTQSKTCAIVFTENAFGYYVKSLPQIKDGEFKYQEAAVEFDCRPDPTLLFKPYAIHLHQKMHDDYVAKGWTVISLRPEQELSKTIIPELGSWVVYLDTRTNRYRYKIYLTIEALTNRGKVVTIEQMLVEINERMNREG